MKYKRSFLVLSILFLIGGGVVLYLTIYNNSKILFGYAAATVLFLIGAYIIYLVIVDDSIDINRKKEIKDLIIKKRNEFKIKSFLDNEVCVVIEIEDETLTYISIFNRKMVIDRYTKEESDKINYLNSIKDESLKKEGFNEIKRKKTSKKINIKNLSSDEIFNLIYNELFVKEN